MLYGKLVMYMNGGEYVITNHGRPLFRNGAEVLWEFPDGETGVISINDAIYLCELSLGLTKANRKYIDIIR